MKKQIYILLHFILFLSLLSHSYSQTDSYIDYQCYRFHQTEALWDGYYAFNLILCSDYAFKGGSAFDNNDLHKLDDFTLSAEDSTTKKIWDIYYNGIKMCNNVLFHLETFPVDNQTFAELKFIRAYNYFHLVRLYGSIPILPSACEPVKNGIIQASENEVYAFIEKELNEAIPDLPLKTELNENEKHKATKGAARAVLANVYLFQEKWEKVEQCLKPMINSGIYSLVEDFSGLWLEKNEHNIESVFEYEYEKDSLDTTEFFLNWNKPNSNMVAYLSGPSEISSNNSNFYRGAGLLNVTQNLVNLYNVNGDSVRKHGTILFLDELLPEESDIDTTAYQYTGYKSKKYTTNRDNCSENNFYNYFQNFVKIRYAEVLLMYAEALAHLNNEKEAIKYVNIIRERAHLPGIDSTSKGTVLLEVIYNERNMELALEGKRYFDLIRWGKANENLSILGFKPETKGKWPIPKSILVQNESFEQNPGYNALSLNEEDKFTEIPNSNSPNVNFPWKKVKSQFYKPLYALRYKYNYCLNDSVLQSRINYQYNSFYLLTQYSHVVYDLAEDKTIELYRENYTYNEQNKISSAIKLKKINNNWDTLGANYYYYPSLESIIDSSITYYLSGSKKATCKNYLWDINNNSYSINKQVWSSYENSWEKHEAENETEKHILTYDLNNNIISDNTLILHYDSSFVKSTKSIWEYNNNNVSCIKHYKYKYNDVLKLNSTITFDWVSNNSYRKTITSQILNYKDNDNRNATSYFISENKDMVESDELYIPLIKKYWLDNYKTFYYNNDQLVTNQSNIDFKISPNPSKGSIWIAGNYPLPAQLKVYSVDGSLISIQYLEHSGQSVNLEYINSGVYFICIGNTSKKLIISK